MIRRQGLGVGRGVWRVDMKEGDAEGETAGGGMGREGTGRGRWGGWQRGGRGKRGATT